ncbi:MAG: response regulator [Rickettsiales bacterium]
MGTQNTAAALSGSKLAKVNVLVIDPDKRITDLLRKVLMSLGFGAIYIAGDGQEGLDTLRKKSVDLVITDWDMTPMDGINFVKYLRTDIKSPTQTMPVIMLTGRAQRRDVEIARDSGMNEFLVKPFTVKTLCDRIILVVEHPRNFILSQGYTGPDRRRKATPPQGIDRRRKGKDVKVIAQHDNMKVIRVGNEDITVVNPEFGIKEKIGFDISIESIFSPENVRRAQDIIHNSSEEFLEWVVDDIEQLEEAYKILESKPGHSREEVDLFLARALTLKSQAGMFGFELASRVAESLNDMCNSSSKIDPSRLRVARQHIDALYVIFQRNIQGTGGVIGRDLMQSLGLLTAKFKHM